jgi:hypothetical protein
MRGELRTRVREQLPLLRERASKTVDSAAMLVRGPAIMSP